MFWENFMFTLLGSTTADTIKREIKIKHAHALRDMGFLSMILYEIVDS